MKVEEIRKLSLGGLEKHIQDLGLAIAKTRAAKKGKQLAAPHAFRGVRKSLARCLTIKKELLRQGGS